MKNLKILPLLLLVPLMASCGTTMMGTYADADKYVTGDQTYESQIETIDIDWISGSIELKYDDEATATTLVEENGDKYEDAYKVHSYLNGTTLYVKYMKSGHVVINSKPKKLLLTYSSAYLENIIVKLTSGKLTSNKLDASEKVSIFMTSGSANIDIIHTKDFSFKMTSGSAIIKDLFTETFTTDMTSGGFDVDIKNFNTGKINSTSGSISVRLPEEGGVVSVKKTSGSVVVKNNEYINASGIYTLKDGTGRIDVNMTSGVIYLY